MEKKRCKVVMLPTEKAENCILKDRDGRMRWEKRYFTQEYLNSSPDSITGLLCPKSYHLYIISDDKIESGDWYIDDVNTVRQSVTDDVDYWKARPEYKKVIATTDSFLFTKCNSHKNVDGNTKGKCPFCKSLPQIPQAFIEEYCRKG